MGGRPAGGDEDPHALSTFDESCVLELPVGLEHRVGVDGHFGDDLLDRREPVPDLEHAHGDGPFHLLNELQVRRHARAAVQVEADRLVQYFPSHLDNSIGRRADVK